MGDSQIVLAGGSDSMSQAPYAVRLESLTS
jgi:acetyl-CoA acetyltransferase